MSDLPPGVIDIASSLGAPNLINSLLGQNQFNWGQGLNQAQYDLSSQLANQQYGITQQQLGVERGGLQRQQQYLPQSEALQSQLLGLQGQDLGISRQQLGLQGQGLDITQQQEQQQADIANRNQWSSATAQGATNTVGNRERLGDIQTNLANQLKQLGLSRQGLGLQGQGLDIQGKRLGIEGQQQGIQNALQQGSLADQFAQLGIQGQQAGNTLQNNLGQAGVNLASGDIGALLTQLGSLTGSAQAGPGFAGQAFGIGGGQQTPAPVGPGTTPGNVNPYNQSVPAGGSRLQ